MHPSSFADGFASPLPLPIRDAGASTSWDTFLAEYAPASGPLQLGQWCCTDPERPAGRLGPQVRHYQATLVLAGTAGTSNASACGPVGALTYMLYQLGITFETTAFHQMPTGSRVATFIEGGDGYHSQWAVGLAGDPVQSALSAVIACANRMLAGSVAGR